MDVRDGAYRSRSRSRDVVRDDDRRGRDGPPGVRRRHDEYRDARARRETPTEPHSNDPNASRSGFGLGYRREDDAALRAALSPSARAPGFGSREGAVFRFPPGPARPPDRKGTGTKTKTRHAGGDYNPLRREDSRVAAATDAGKKNKKSIHTEGTSHTASYEYLVASGSLGWRASGGALPRRAERIEGVGDETLASLTASLRDARDASRRRREAEETFYENTRSGDGSFSNGFEALESRRAFSTRRVGAAIRERRGERFASNDERLGDGGETKKKNDDAFPGRETKNRGVAARARADDVARAEADFASSADGVREALAKKAETYSSLLLRKKETGARDGYGVDFDAKSAADAAAFRDAEPTVAEVPPPPPGGPRGEDAATRAKKRERLLALRNRGRERTTT